MRVDRIALCATFFLGLALAGATAAAGAEISKSIRLFIDNQTSSFPVTAFLEKFPTGSEEFKPGKDGKLEYNLTISPEQWFTRATVRLVWKNAFQDRYGNRIDYSQRLYFRFRRDFAKNLPIIVHFGNDRTGSTVSDLERRTDINDQFEVFLRLTQIATFYRDRPDMFARTSNTSFHAAKALAEHTDSPHELGDDVLKLAIDGNPDRRVYFEGLARDVQSNYWLDFKFIKKFAETKKCNAAWTIQQTLEVLKSDRPSDFELRQLPRNALANTRGILIKRCGKPNAPKKNQGAIASTPPAPSNNR